MRRLLRWMIGLASALAVWRLWARRHVAVEVPPEPDPAEALRQKPSETRNEDEAEAPAAEAVDERRARVHAKAQETIDAMREGDA